MLIAAICFQALQNRDDVFQPALSVPQDLITAILLGLQPSIHLLIQIKLIYSKLL